MGRDGQGWAGLRWAGLGRAGQRSAPIPFPLFMGLGGGEGVENKKNIMFYKKKIYSIKIEYL